METIKGMGAQDMFNILRAQDQTYKTSNFSNSVIKLGYIRLHN
jgi:hypothetical protein